MSIFDVGTGELQGSAVTPVSPVANTNKLYNLGALNSVVSTAGKVYADVQKQKASDEKDSFVNDVEIKAKDLAIAAKTGQMKGSDALTKINLLYKQAQASPGAFRYREDLDSSYAFVIGNAGLGKPLTEQTEAERVNKKIIDQAIKNGAIFPWMNHDEQIAAASNDQLRTASIKQLEEMQKRQTLANSEQSYNIGQQTMVKNNQSIRSNELSYTKQRDAFQTQSLVDQGFGADSVLFNNEMKDLESQKDSAGDNPDRIREINHLIDFKLNQRRALLTQLGARAGSDYFNPYLKVYEERAQLAKLYKDGKTEASDYQSLFKKTLAKHEYIMFTNADTQMKNFVATSAMFPQSDLLKLTGNQVGLRFLKMNTDKEDAPANLLTFNSKDYADVSAYKDAVLNSAVAVKAGKGNEQLKTELSNNINKILIGVDDYSKAGKSPENYNALVDMLADPRFKDAMAVADVSSEAMDAAKNVLQVNYMDKILPALQKQWETQTFNQTASGEALAKKPDSGKGSYDVQGISAPVKDYVEPVFMGGKVMFVPKNIVDGAYKEIGTDALRTNMYHFTNQPVKVKQDVIDNLNKTYGAILTKATRAWSNVSDGGESYQQVFEKYIKPYAFGIKQEDKPNEPNSN